MSQPLRLTVREMLIAVVVIAATATGIVFLVNDIRSPGTNYCIAVEPGASALIAGESLTPVEVVAARDPWISARDPKPFKNYYVVAMIVTTPDGATAEGLWGVGTNNDGPADGAALSFDPEHSVITSLDQLAVERTQWPELALPFQVDGTPASRALECLNS